MSSVELSKFPLTQESAEAAYAIWDYLRVEDDLQEVYAIMAMGCSRPEIAIRAGRLFKLGITSLVISTGGNSKKTNDWVRTEAEVYDEILDGMGIPANSRLKEQESESFGGNIQNTHRLLENMGGQPDVMLGVTIDFATRRWKASMEKQWAGVKPLVVPAGIEYSWYLENEDRFSNFAYNLTDELKKVITYPFKGDNGFMTAQRWDDPGYILAKEAKKRLIYMKFEASKTKHQVSPV